MEKRRVSHRYMLVGVASAGLMVAAGAGVLQEVKHPPVGQLEYTYQGHNDQVNSVAWSSDGKHIASAGNNGTIQVWNPTDGSDPYTHELHNEP